MSLSSDKSPQNLRKCRCGGKVAIWGGLPWHQGYEVVCSKCGGRWDMSTYSKAEAESKWGYELQEPHDISPVMTFNECTTTIGNKKNR